MDFSETDQNRSLKGRTILYRISTQNPGFLVACTAFPRSWASLKNRGRQAEGGDQSKLFVGTRQPPLSILAHPPSLPPWPQCMSRGLFIPFKPLFPVIQAIYKKAPVAWIARRVGESKKNERERERDGWMMLKWFSLGYLSEPLLHGSPPPPPCGARRWAIWTSLTTYSWQKKKKGALVEGSCHGHGRKEP